MYEAVIGLEVHVQLSTVSKIFSGSSTAFGAEPNTQASLVDLGMPGVLPVPNARAFEMAVKFGLAIDAEIGKESVFDRKNYFYPDLPKGYQISQFDKPIVGPGRVAITLDDGTIKTINVTRAHLEEDAGKSVHDAFDGMTGVDLNRAGTPLLEIVSEPELRSAKEAVAYLKVIHSIIRYLDISDGNMAQGSMRCDCNVSIRPQGSEVLGTRTEIKNVNSFRFVEKAINTEIHRQIEILEDGGRVIQETRLYDPDKDETRSMRSKEEANDYRYFPDPDLLPVMIDDSFIEACRNTLPELPEARQARYIKDYGITDYDAGVLVADRDVADYFAEVADTSGEGKLAANWVMGSVLAELNQTGSVITEFPVSAKQLADLISRIKDNTLNSKTAKTVFEALLAGEGEVNAIIEAKGLVQMTDTGAIEAIVDEVIQENPDQVANYRSAPSDKQGKMLGFFVGQVMKKSQGKANPQAVNQILHSKLGS
ncbi:MAG TPA: Asp-tRNA(Asn)/Glu-tRNA(Gln) amidotransferase GatCAB subunit B [Gammaproteobacteria bacterium]|jgi:aspartyl-tRNA(Asn)/glutamyl-tRNA(Gln) amidotransferase subunit B|nr:Asp-tRNA(Asn)/Glu-tRNA(Gln) amidotransferase subunit GatB [Oceanospirillales bacterium]MDA0894529.1 Asp-tRNA(Asn)/Glu-tRNA(Gln) amidotransferase subunit GatB [Pseudomonadota bacterium]MDB2425338.1 Asp-tRNA(Asn)/Glu-tRNA(Gln) amidotransferase subunit GatB [Litorivicinaceae bacterium]MDC1087880.1 Asp-tRNA(Asn)/Glu-tRNA(Gln) amidotransferase subunit GatB [Litorivicinus sp.]HAB68888.1 Asp-tRNA(Asn)/Glu-tRNA(Gln) amidotransferase GatCAB subunit B [Gammaproteobacteria bacterium]